MWLFIHCCIISYVMLQDKTIPQIVKVTSLKKKKKKRYFYSFSLFVPWKQIEKFCMNNTFIPGQCLPIQPGKWNACILKHDRRGTWQMSHLLFAPLHLHSRYGVDDLSLYISRCPKGVLPEQSYSSLNHDIEWRMYTAYTTIPFDYLLLNL